jgi:hypothetical protein
MTRCQKRVSTTPVNCGLLVWSKPGRPGTRGVSSQVSGHEKQVGGDLCTFSSACKMLDPNGLDAGNTASLLISVAASLSVVLMLAERKLSHGVPSTVRPFQASHIFLEYRPPSNEHNLWYLTRSPEPEHGL